MNLKEAYKIRDEIYHNYEDLNKIVIRKLLDKEITVSETITQLNKNLGNVLVKLSNLTSN